MQQLAKGCADLGAVEVAPRFFGRSIVMILGPAHAARTREDEEPAPQAENESAQVGAQ